MANFSTIGKRAAAFSGGNLISIFVGGAAFPLLSYAYTPEEFGRYSLFLYTAGVFAGIAGLRLELALVTTVDDLKAILLLRAGLFSSILLGLLAFVVSFFVCNDLTFLGIFSAFFYVCSFGWLNLLIAWHVRLKHFWFAGNLGLANSAFTLVCQLVLARYLSENGLYVGNVLGCIFALMIALLPRDDSLLSFRNFLKFDFRAIADIFIEYKYLLGSNSLQGIVNSSSLAIFSYGVSIVGGSSAVGFFSACLKILVIPVRLLGSSLRTSLLQGLGRLPDQDAKHMALQYSVFLVPISIIVFIAAGYLLPYAVNLFMSKNWQGVSQYILPLSSWLVISIVYVPAIAWLNVRKQVWPHLGYELFNLLGRVGILAIAIWQGWGVLTFVWWACLISFVLGVLLCVVSFSKLVKSNNEGN